MLKYRLIIAALLLCLFATTAQASEGDVQYTKTAAEFLTAFEDGNYDDAYAAMSETMQAAISLEQFAQVDAQLTAMYGAFLRITDDLTQADAPVVQNGVSYRQVFAVADYENALITFGIPINEETGEVEGFFVSDVRQKEKKELPEGLVEETVIVGEGGEYPLEGTLTYPTNATHPLPAVVLVHGSGASDRDETIYQNKPFRDIAWGLAQQGIAVLRYDKRTYTYGGKISAENIRMTVKSETVDDAVLAMELLRANPLIDPDRVGVIGHSLGGMLATTIDDEANAWKLVIMAGTMRPLWAVLEEQIAGKSPEEQEAYAQINTVDVDKLHETGNFSFISDTDAVDEMFYIIPVDYLKDMEKYDLTALAIECDRPMLILQGGEDYQIFADRDFKLWQETLEGKPDVIMKEYPLLNHLFQVRNTENEDVFQEYVEVHPVDETVILDIAAFLLQE